MISTIRGFFDSNKIPLILMLGTIIAQIFSFVSIFVLAHHFSPLIYGQYALIIVIINAAVPLSILKLETLAVIESTSNLVNILFIALRRLLLISVLVSLAFAVVVIREWGYVRWEAFLIILLIFTSNYVFNCNLLTLAITLKFKRYSTVALSGIIQNGFTLAIQFVFIQVSNSLLSLLVSLLIGRLISVFFLFTDSTTTIAFLNVYNQEKKRFASDRKRIRKDAVNLSISNFLDQITLSAPVLIAFVSNQNSLVGVVSFALSLVLAPVTIVTSAFTMLFQSQHNRFETNLGDRMKLRKNFGFLLTFSLSFLFVTFLTSDYLLNNFFQESWRESSYFIKALAVPVSAMIITTPYIQLLVSRGNSKTALVSGFLSTVLSLVIGALVMIFKDINTAVSLILYARVAGHLFAITRHLGKR
jgi:O-antigen/teichoic acid export membrane protein